MDLMDPLVFLKAIDQMAMEITVLACVCDEEDREDSLVLRKPNTCEVKGQSRKVGQSRKIGQNLNGSDWWKKNCGRLT